MHQRAPSVSERAALALPPSHARTSPSTHSLTRRGSLYVLVLFAVTAAATIVMGGYELQRSLRRWTQLETDAAQARTLAQGGLELAMQLMNSAPTTWRTTLPSTGAWINSTFGRARLTVTATDPVDATFSNNASDPVVLVSSATLGNAAQYAQVTLVPKYTPDPLLSLAGAFTGNLTFTSASVSSTNTIATAAKATASSSTIAASIQTVSGATGSTYTGTATTAAAPTIPTYATLAAAYTSGKAKGSISLLSGRTLTATVVAPGSNPFGVPNAADGVYYVDCAGAMLTIKDCRIVGTLVLLNATAGVTISGSVAWEPASTGYPALITDGGVTINTSANALSEASLGVNLNAVGIGIALTNSTLTDTYPSQIKGVVYAASDVNVTGVATIQGLLISRAQLAVTGTLIIKPNSDLAAAPPPGLRSGPLMVVSPGTWLQVTK